MKFFDSHAHYYDDRFESEYDGSVDDLIGALLSKDVSHIVNVGTSPKTSRLAIAQARRFENMYTAIGIHPSDSQYLDVGLDEAIADIEALIKDGNNKCVALGEIGLDYHYPDTDKAVQMKFLEAQMTLASELDIPVVIHDRDSHADIMEVVRRYPRVRGVFHSYSGAADQALELIKLGYMISFSGTITFTNARKPREVAAVIPRDRVLIETDAPYLAPHPKRGSLNHSGNLVYTNAALAAAWSVTDEECANITLENSRRFFGIK